MENCQDDECIRKIVSSAVKDCSVLVGFDGFVDRLTRPIRKRNNDGTTCFQTLSEFAEFLSSKGGMSGSIELEQIAIKLGGNNPITSYALGKAGANVYTIGAYGNPYINPIFGAINKYCKLYSFTAPGECWSYEFADNKIMNFINMKAEDFTYQKIVNAVNDTTVEKILTKCDLIALLNYSEQTNVLAIWEGMLQYNCKGLVGKKVYIDLSDCTRISSAYVFEAFGLIDKLTQISDVYLSLNDNEFLKLLQLYVDDSVSSAILQDTKLVKAYLLKLKAAIKVKCIILRTLEIFYGLQDDILVLTQNIIEQNPCCLTGAGDNQNAGICIGLCCNLSLLQSLRLGTLYGSYYMRKGKSGTFEDVMNQLTVNKSNNAIMELI